MVTRAEEIKKARWLDEAAVVVAFAAAAVATVVVATSFAAVA